MEHEESVIVISDTEGENDGETSVFIVENSSDVADASKEKSTEVIDEECGLAITYSKKGNVMPHARYDCVEQDFTRTENEISEPAGSNAFFCEQCYCYICDKPASECQYWKLPSVCHCNAHNKSTYWKAHRDVALTGALSIFNFNLVDIDSELRHGGALLQKFWLELAMEYNKYLMGIITTRNCLIPCNCICHKQVKIFCEMCHLNHVEIRLYSYTAVFNVVNNFLNRAENEKPKAAAIMMIGVAKEILLHKQPPQESFNKDDQTSSPRQAVPIFMHRITNALQRMLVLSDFPPHLFNKLKAFYKTLPLPSYCYAFTSSLNVLSWEDPFLTSILRGQNITGHRQKKGKKEVLWEDVTVLQARVERMEARKEYRELIRYLRVVKCSDTLKLRALQDKIPFYFCKCGDFHAATQSFHSNSSLSCCTACRLTPYQYMIYLKILKTGTVPTGCELSEEGNWIFVKGASLVNDCLLLKCALRILFVNEVLYGAVHCWSRLIQIQCNSFKLTEDVLQVPPPIFVNTTAVHATAIIEDLKNGIVGIPKAFSSAFHRESALILVTVATAQMLHQNLSMINIVLPLVVAYGKNFWALKLLFDSLSMKEDILHHFCGKLCSNIYVYKNILIDAFKCHDADYISDLVTLFLSFKQATIQSVSIPVLNVLVESWHEIKNKGLHWTQTLHSFLQNKVIPAMEMLNTAQFVELRNKLSQLI
ncbi:uncharacterized protein zgc:112980 [Stegostoma tigrinum]|uniref:uncharacterized protein zgc:112980 n=1 Tax=Stegostoma tigrinum TaxID=3053191 RepID=UPI00202B5679|nr:uncharacterized protein zgc:112980 [Stegostoma tigrinum]XP_059509894.1 uncharacterized protein zgc:112980 [Stegostoma tigrinum]